VIYIPLNMQEKKLKIRQVLNGSGGGMDIDNFASKIGGCPRSSTPLETPKGEQREKEMAQIKKKNKKTETPQQKRKKKNQHKQKPPHPS